MFGSEPHWWRQPGSQPVTGTARRIIVVTDIDETLPEPGTRPWPDEQAALDFLAARGIPLVINSSRTRAEIERLRQRLHVSAPFICEYGSALFLPQGCLPFAPERVRPAVGSAAIEFGKRYREVVEGLRLTCSDLDVEVAGFSELSIEDVAREFGVAIVEAQLAKLREYTELFRIVDETDAKRRRLVKALRRRGLGCWRASAYHVVSGTGDRAESLRTLRAIWRQAWGDPVMIGFGNSEDDLAWLRHVDVAVMIQSHGTGVPARVLSKLPAAHVTRQSGRQGWSEAVFEFVGGLLTPRLQTQRCS